MVRGLALRSLCNLRLITILEYVEAPLQKCLKDPSAYVRKTSVMGVLKVRNSTLDILCFHIRAIEVLFLHLIGYADYTVYIINYMYHFTCFYQSMIMTWTL